MKPTLAEATALLEFDLTENQKACVQTYIDCDCNYSEAAREMGISTGPFIRNIERAQRRASKQVFTEQTSEFHDWSPDECMASLMEIVETHPQKVITRNFYRNETGVSDSTWSRHFGTFEEFKRQSHVIPSRHVHQVEKQVAKHASFDSKKPFNEQKMSYEGKYQRQSNDRFVTHIGISDVHDKDCDSFTRNVFIDTIKRVQPEVITLNGDIFDLPEFGKFTQDPRDWDVIGRIKWVHDFLSDIREACPLTQIDYIEGNHEFRLIRHLSEASPAMMVVLSDLHGFDIPSLLKIDEYKINYIARANLKAFRETDIKSELKKNYRIYHDAYVVTHGDEGRKKGMAGYHGHHHKHIVWNEHSPLFGSYEWHQLGCGHRREASYTDGEKWSNGFMIIHVDTEKKRAQFEYIDTTHDICCVGGKYHYRGNEA